MFTYAQTRTVSIFLDGQVEIPLLPEFLQIVRICREFVEESSEIANLILDFVDAANDRAVLKVLESLAQHHRQVGADRDPVTLKEKRIRI